MQKKANRPPVQKRFRATQNATRSGANGAIRNRNLAASELTQDDLQFAEQRARTLYDEIRQKTPDITNGNN